jgi:hypothetical protein
MSVSVSGDVLLDSRPPPAPKGGEPMQGNNSPVNKRTVRPRCKIGTAAWQAAAEASTPTWIAVFPPWFSGLRGGPHPPVPGS